MKAFGEMTILEQCEWHMVHGAPDGRSVRNVCEIVERHRDELEGLDDTTVAVLEEMLHGYAARRAQVLDTYQKYLAWAREHVGGTHGCAQ